MRIKRAIQENEVSDILRAKMALAAPTLDAMLYSINAERAERLGGLKRLRLCDLAMAAKESSGDFGICFELQIHEAIANKNQLIHPRVSEVVEKFSPIKGQCESILFGPEKNGKRPILESASSIFTTNSRVLPGKVGQPPLIKAHLPKIVAAAARRDLRRSLPRSIAGLWKADLFIGVPDQDRWLGTTIKSNAQHLESAAGLRLAIYPEQDLKDIPRIDESNNLIRCPLPYDAAFMELSYKAFFLVRAFLRSDARVPKPIELPDSGDRLLTGMLEDRREFLAIDVIDWLRSNSQSNLIKEPDFEDIDPHRLSTDEANAAQPQGELFPEPPEELLSLAPAARVGK